jgi:glutamine cyclotransferase
MNPSRIHPGPRAQNRHWVIWLIWLLLGLSPGCSAAPPTPLVQWNYEVLEELPHDWRAFTQGLLIHDGVFYESTGQYGESDLRKVEIATGKVLQERPLEPHFFGEGLALLEGKLYQLTWKAGTLLIWDLATLQQQETQLYWEEGWGLTTDGTHFIMSDGSPTLYFRDPEDFQIDRKIRVTVNGKPLKYLNELEFIDGKIWANVWGENYLARIDPATGRVLAVLDLNALIPRKPAPNQTTEPEVLNGIAWDPEERVMYVTGKYWPVLYKLRLIPEA